ncbi:hypothetical protein QE386_001955 [Pseudoxanthomonas winnipegensis]|nr:hypothetical protein [Pseudoxanthomonas winnipegensis]
MARSAPVQARQRRPVGRRGDHDRATQAFLAEGGLDEIAHFAAAFADQAHDDDIGRGVAGHHAQQRRLAHARAGEQAHALAAADGQHGVDGAHADIERFDDGLARERIDRHAGQGDIAFGADRALAVQRRAVVVDDPAQQAFAHRDLALGAGGDDARIGQQALQVAGRHQEGALAGEADHLGIHPAPAGGGHAAARAHWRAAAGGFQGQAHRAAQHALAHQTHRFVGRIGLAQSLRQAQIAGALQAIGHGVVGQGVHGAGACPSPEARVASSTDCSRA